MHISFTSHDSSQSTSSFGVIDYLDKENQTKDGKENEKEFDGFFSSHYSEANTNENVPIDEIVNSMDANRGTQNLKQSNFYMLNVSPSKKELQHMEKLATQELSNRGLHENLNNEVVSTIFNEQKDALMKMQVKLYTKDLMSEYAANFDREIYVDESLLPSKKERQSLEEQTDKLFKADLKEIGIELADDAIEKSKQYVTIEKDAIIGEDDKHYLLELDTGGEEKEKVNMPKKVLFEQKDGSYKLPVNFYEKKLQELSKDQNIAYVGVEKENLEVKTSKKKEKFYLLEQTDRQLKEPLKLYFKEDEVVEQGGKFQVNKRIFEQQHKQALNKAIYEQYGDKRAEIFEKLAKDKGYNLDKRKLTVDDLLWYGKVENRRTHKPSDRYVIKNVSTLKEIENLSADKKGNSAKIKALENQLIRDEKNHIIKAGMKKEGLQYHAHIVVSRHDKTMQKAQNKISLSPLANHKKGKMYKGAKVGFDRDRFSQNAETLFDKKFQYKRAENETYKAYKEAKKQRSQNGQSNSVQSKVSGKAKGEVKGFLMRHTGVSAIKQHISPVQNIKKQLGIASIPSKIPKSALDLAYKIGKKIIDQGLSY